ncbi:YfhO family protein [Chloroflexia bacterium SDU3-3]|nr:YfhO family protein [Chloroflexia bacterium SDU3-3]
MSVARILTMRRVGWMTWRDVAPPLAVALLPFVLFFSLSIGRSTFYVHDVQLYFYPYHAVSANIARGGDLPLWNPYAFSGIPLVGDGQTAMFYPPNWVFFVLPGALALSYAILLQFSIAGVGMYFCALGLGARRFAAVFAALAFMFCGMMTARVVHLSIMSGVALVPWLVLCVDRALGVGYGWPTPSVGRWRWLLAAAAVAALQAVAGHPQVPVYTGVAMGFLLLFRLIEVPFLHGARGLLRALWALPLRLAGVYLLGYALAAIQLVPWVELGMASPRAANATFEFVMDKSSAGADWLLFLFPYIFGSQLPGPFADRPMSISLAVRSWEHSAYVGIPTLALAGVGVLLLAVRTWSLAFSWVRSSWRLPTARHAEAHTWFSLVFLVFLVLVGALTAAGDHTPFGWVVYALPVVGKLRAVERALVLVDVALPLLAALGMQWLADAPGRRVAARVASALAGVAIVALPGLALWLIHRRAQSVGVVPNIEYLADFARTDVSQWLPLGLGVLTCTLLVLWAVRRPGLVSQSWMVAVLLLDMGVYAMYYNPTTAASLFSTRPDVLQALGGDGQPFRKATALSYTNALPNRAAQEALSVSWAMVYGVEDMNGFNSLQPRRYTDYVFGTDQEDVSYGFLTNPRLFQPDSPILSSLNVRYVLVPTSLPPPLLGDHLKLAYSNSDVQVYENTLVWPRAYFAERVRGEPDPQAVLRTVTAPGFDGRREALVESAQPPQLADATGPATVEIRSSRPNSMELATQTSEPRLLVLSEMYFPGWRAYVDGVEVPIERTNYLFRGVVVPAGEHQVRFVYQPLSVLIGLLISLAAWAVVALIWWRTRQRRA